MSQEIQFGYGKINELGNALRRYKPGMVFLVTGMNSYDNCGIRELVEPQLDGFNFERFSDFHTDPTVSDVEVTLDAHKSVKPDMVVSVGGGSVMDVAKMANILAANSQFDPVAYIMDGLPLEHRGKMHIAMPTTAGTGSESTHFATVYKDKRKYSLSHEKHMVPDIAIIDPNLTLSMPELLTAQTGIDVLTQGIESYWAVGANDESKSYARECIALSMKNLKKVVLDPDSESRAAMSQAANLSGRAINISKTTACHTISYPFYIFYGMHHGQAVSLTLPSMLRFNGQVDGRKVIHPRGNLYVKDTMTDIYSMIGARGPDDARDKISGLMTDIGLKTRLRDIGMNSESEIDDQMMHNFSRKRLSNGPVSMSDDDIREMLHEIY